MFETDAETKTCPISFSRPSSNGVFTLANCVGSDCMLWRWRIMPEAQGPDPQPKRLGYCGLGSKDDAP